MEVITKKMSEIRPYERNPRKNDDAVKYVQASIEEFGFKVPIVIDANGVIVAGHTRYKAAKKLGMKSVPCIVADDLSEEQIKAFRLADNKTAEKAAWDFQMLESEMDEILGFDFEQFGFEPPQEISLDQLFEDEEQKKGTNPKYCTCPKCGEVFEA